jgi:peptide/nickel transport system permease protein
MLPYLLRRVAIAVPTLAIISVIIFAIIALAPGDPFTSGADSQRIPPEVFVKLRRDLGLDEPVHIQYLKWMSSVLRGQFGYSFSGGVEVGRLISERLPTTLFIMGVAYVLGLLVAMIVGVASAVRQNSTIDNLGSAFAYVGFSLPPFFTALLLIVIFTANLRILPMSYVTTVPGEGMEWVWGSLKQAVMPIAVIGLYEGAVLTRYVRAAMIDVLTCDFVRTARSKGLDEFKVVTRHALRNALIPVVTIAAIQAPGLFTGSIVVEQVFTIPGIGTLLLRSYESKDVPVMMAILSIYSVLVVGFNLVADVLYHALDPRIRHA